jgi:transposase
MLLHINESKTATKIALGLDVAKSTIEIYLLDEEGRGSTYHVSNNREGFLQLAAWLHGQPLEQIHACLEPTGKYSRALAYFLLELGLKVSQVNCNAIGDYRKSLKVRSKTDRIDSRMLALYCLKHDLPIWEKPSDCELELTCIQSRLNNLDQDIRREKNRLEGGVECRLVQEDIEENIVRLKFRAEKLEKAAKQLIRDNAKLKADFEILKSIIGIGDKSAIRLLASVSFDDFETGRKVASFAGLTPPKYQSGTSINSRRRISRMGNPQLRRGLFMPAMVAMQHNPQLRRFAERLAARNKPPKVIIIAVMRKLLALAAALLRKREFYDPTFS